MRNLEGNFNETVIVAVKEVAVKELVEWLVDCIQFVFFNLSVDISFVAKRTFSYLNRSKFSLTTFS